MGYLKMSAFLIASEWLLSCIAGGWNLWILYFSHLPVCHS